MSSRKSAEELSAQAQAADRKIAELTARLERRKQEHETERRQLDAEMTVLRQQIAAPPPMVGYPGAFGGMPGLFGAAPGGMPFGAPPSPGGTPFGAPPSPGGMPFGAPPSPGGMPGAGGVDPMQQMQTQMQMMQMMAQMGQGNPQMAQMMQPMIAQMMMGAANPGAPMPQMPMQMPQVAMPQAQAVPPMATAAAGSGPPGSVTSERASSSKRAVSDKLASESTMAGGGSTLAQLSQINSLKAEKERLAARSLSASNRASSASKSTARTSSSVNRLESARSSSICASYSVHAGSSVINGGPRDTFGNAAGSGYDLGLDGAFKGSTVAVLHLYSGEGFDFSLPKAALEEKGFDVKRWTSVPPCAELKEALQQCTQLWIISSNIQYLTAEHMSVIKEFWERGNGVAVWGDNEPYYADANFALKSLLPGCSMSGNLPGNKTVGLREDKEDGKAGFRQHLITTAIQQLYEGITIATINLPPDAAKQQIYQLINGSAGNLVTAILDSNNRLIVDGGFTRLFCQWDTAGSARYVKNVACWLDNRERREHERWLSIREEERKRSDWSKKSSTDY